MNFYEAILYLSCMLFKFLNEHKLKSDMFSGVFTGVAIGVIANVMFVITTEKDYNLLSLTLSFTLAIILLIIGNIEKKEK